MQNTSKDQWGHNVGVCGLRKNFLIIFSIEQEVGIMIKHDQISS
jgi:hypothetical protein